MPTIQYVAAVSDRTRVIILRRRPSGLPREEDFALSDQTLDGEGELEVMVEWLAMDPYLRLQLAGRHLAPPVGEGEVIPGQGVGRVVATSLPERFPLGTRVVGTLGWRERGWVSERALLPFRLPDDVPSTLLLGALGMPGLTAWVGLERAALAAGEVLVVSAAAGTVGLVAAQLGQARGAKVIGITSATKITRLADFGFDALVARDAPDFRTRLAEALPDGLDVYFDNVGGAVLDAALDHLRRGSRVILCGMIGEYHAQDRPPGPHLGRVIAARASLHGIAVYDHLAAYERFLGEALPLWRSGRLRVPERVLSGLEQAPGAFIELMSGTTLGRVLVRVGNGG